MSWCALCAVTELPQKEFFLGDPTQRDALRCTHRNAGCIEMLNCDRKHYISKLVTVSGGDFSQVALVSLALFALSLSTLWVYWPPQLFCGAMWDSVLYRSERRSFEEHFFQQQCQHTHPLISPSPLPPLTHPSAVPMSVLCGKRIAGHIQAKNSWKRKKEKWIPEPGLTSYVYIQSQYIRICLAQILSVCMAPSVILTWFLEVPKAIDFLPKFCDGFLNFCEA